MLKKNTIVCISETIVPVHSSVKVEIQYQVVEDLRMQFTRVFYNDASI